MLYICLIDIQIRVLRFTCCLSSSHSSLHNSSPFHRPPPSDLQVASFGSSLADSSNVFTSPIYSSSTSSSSSPSSSSSSRNETGSLVSLDVDNITSINKYKQKERDKFDVCSKTSSVVASTAVMLQGADINPPPQVFFFMFMFFFWFIFYKF
jgi:hypothetical protein